MHGANKSQTLSPKRWPGRKERTPCVFMKSSTAASTSASLPTCLAMTKGVQAVGDDLEVLVLLGGELDYEYRRLPFDHNDEPDRPARNGIRDKELFPGYFEMVADQYRRRPESGQVRAGAGLGESE